MVINECGIYKIANTITGDFYIGSSGNINRRISEHRCTLANNVHRNIHLQRAWNKYGEQAFEFKAILLCDIKYKLYFEQGFIDLFKPVYNVATNASAPMQGQHHTTETRAKQSEAHKGNKSALGHKHTTETRAKLSEANKGKTNALGHKHTEEAKRKLSESHSGDKHPFYGKHHSDETRAKISAAAKGKVVSEETRAKMSRAQAGELSRNFGKHFSEETRAKMSASHKVHWQNKKAINSEED